MVGEQEKEVEITCVHVCKRGFGTTCKESVKYIKVDILFKTKSTEIPNQKKRKENGPL